MNRAVDVFLDKVTSTLIFFERQITYSLNTTFRQIACNKFTYKLRALARQQLRVIGQHTTFINCQIIGHLPQKNHQSPYYKIPTLSPNKSIPRIYVSQTFLSWTNFIEKSNNIYDIKLAHYENIFHVKSNDTSLLS